MCHGHFQRCSRFLPRNHPLQSLLPHSLQDPTPSNTHSFQNTTTTNGCKKSYPPPIASRVPPPFMLLLHSVFSTTSPLLLFHCHVNSWHENCPDTLCWPTTSNAQLEATSWCCAQTIHLLLCPTDPTQHQSFKKGTGASESKTSAPLVSISHTRKQD